MVLPLKRSKSARRIPPWLHNSSGFFLVTTTAIAWFSIFETSTWKAVHKIESEPQPPDAIILPIPPSGNENYPYFVNVTTARERIDSIIRNDVVVIEQQYDKHHRGYHLVTTNYPWSIVLPGMSDSDRLNEKDMFISPLQRTSRQAANHRCDIVATNGGPFDKGGKWNSGPTVSKGRMIRTKPFPEKSQFVGFGIAHRSIPSGSNTSGNSTNYRHWVLGEYSQLIRSSSPLSIWDFVTGFGWLVYDGKPRVTRSSNHSAMKKHNPTGAVRAPRTAVGLDKDSNLMLLVVDGCQNCLFRKGLTLEEVSDLLVDLGAVYAINMDGGGSSTMVMPSDFVTPGTITNQNSSIDTKINEHRKYKVVNRPTCLDIPVPLCEREVSTVLCVSTNGDKQWQ